MRILMPMFLVALLLKGSLEASEPVASNAMGSSIQEKSHSVETDKNLADKRFAEMLDRMQGAVEEVAQLYGNPSFLQVFTNEPDRAEDLKRRLRAAGSLNLLSTELETLEKKRALLLADIALKSREAARLSEKLVRQRAALDAIQAALEQARRAVEDTTKTVP